MNIIVKDLHGKTININTKRIDSIQSIKEKIQKRTGILVNDQLLTFTGKYLENYKKLFEYNILRNSILNLSLGLKGGALGPFQSGSPNTDGKTATVGVAFTYTAVNASGCVVYAGSTSNGPSSLTVSVVSNQLVLSGTPVSGDLSGSPYTVIMQATSSSGTAGQLTFTFLLTINTTTACIVSGQRILTPNGYKLIDNIYNGDLITTSENKEVKVLNYRGDFEFTTKDTAPYIIPKDSIYYGCPQKDIFLLVLN